MTTMTTTITTTIMTMITTISTEMATDRSSGGGTGGGGAVLFPGIDKNDDESNMNARKRETNRAKTKTGVGDKVVGLDTSIWDGPPTSWRAGGLLFMLIRRGVVLKRILLGKKNHHLKQSIILPQTKYQRRRRISFPRKRGNSAGESKRLPLHPPSKCKT